VTARPSAFCVAHFLNTRSRNIRSCDSAPFSGRRHRSTTQLTVDELTHAQACCGAVEWRSQASDVSRGSPLGVQRARSHAPTDRRSYPLRGRTAPRRRYTPSSHPDRRIPRANGGNAVVCSEINNEPTVGFSNPSTFSCLLGSLRTELLSLIWRTYFPNSAMNAAKVPMPCS
jgi:hypothetical protein